MLMPQGYSSEVGTCTTPHPALLFEELSELLVTSRDGVECLVVQHAVFDGGGWSSRLVLWREIACHMGVKNIPMTVHKARMKTTFRA
jgi:hypothetical protein